MRDIKIPANVLLTIENYCYDTFSEMKTSQIEKMIDATVITWDIVYGMYSRFGTNDYGYFPVYSQNRDLLSIDIVINGNRYRYNTFIDILCDNLILMQNPNNYSTGSDTTKSFTKSYMLNCEWGNLHNYTINYVKYKQNPERDKEELFKEYPEHKDLINILHRVQIDVEGMVRYLESNIGKKLKPKAYKTTYGRTVIDKDRVIDESTIYRCLYDALRINNRKIYYTVNNRVYSSLSNLSSLVNDFIYIDGVKMVQVDAVNCQPLLLNTLVEDSNLKNVCERGKFYEVLMQATGIEDRDEIKIMCYRDLFFGNYKPNSILGKVFESIFPHAHKYLLNYRYDFDETLAKTLQMREAEIFIPIALKLAQDYPVITKHDALLIPINKVAQTRIELSHKFLEYGVLPRF